MENEKPIVFSESESFDPEEISVEGKGYFVSTGELAAYLKTSRDMVRNHIRDFEDYFDVSYTKEGKGGHIRFPSSQIELLEMIIRLRKTKSVEEVKEILDDPEMPYLFQKGERTEKQLGVMLAENNKYLVSLMEQLFSKTLDEKLSPLLASKDEALADKQKDLERVMQLNEELAKQNEELRATVEKSSSQLKEMNESNQRREQQLNDILEKLPNNQKRGLFSFFKK